MQLALRPNAASLGSAPAASRQAVKGRKTALVVPNAVKDVFMPALRWDWVQLAIDRLVGGLA